MTPSPAIAAAVRHAREAIEQARSVILAGGDAVTALESAELLGRAVDGLRVRAAGMLAHDPVAAERLGFASATDAVASLARVSQRTARARLAVAAAVTENRTITGAPIPAAYPHLDRAIAAGEVGIDAAALLTAELDAVRGRVEPGALRAAEALVVSLATTGAGADAAAGDVPVPISLPISVEALASEVRQVTATIDPDGARPREERAVRRRGFRIGAQDADGLIPVSGRLLPDVGGLLAGLIEAQRRSPRFVDSTFTMPDMGSPDGADVDLAAGGHDSRTPDQRRHDALAEIVAAAATAESGPRLDGLPVTVLVTVTAADLADESGRDGDPIGSMAGSRFPVSRAAICRFVDNSGMRLVRLTDTGAVAGISSVQRCFTATQRLAIAARDGARCATPGCTSPHYALQVHHVVPARDGGPTDTCNGILLCYWHHRRVDDGPWEYRMIDGRPQVRGPGILEWRPLRAPRARAA